MRAVSAERERKKLEGMVERSRGQCDRVMDEENARQEERDLGKK